MKYLPILALVCVECVAAGELDRFEEKSTGTDKPPPRHTEEESGGLLEFLGTVIGWMGSSPRSSSAELVRPEPPVRIVADSNESEKVQRMVVRPAPIRMPPQERDSILPNYSTTTTDDLWEGKIIGAPFAAKFSAEIYGGKNFAVSQNDLYLTGLYMEVGLGALRTSVEINQRFEDTAAGAMDRLWMGRVGLPLLSYRAPLTRSVQIKGGLVYNWLSGNAFHSGVGLDLGVDVWLTQSLLWAGRFYVYGYGIEEQRPILSKEFQTQVQFLPFWDYGRGPSMGFELGFAGLRAGDVGWNEFRLGIVGYY